MSGFHGRTFQQPRRSFDAGPKYPVIQWRHDAREGGFEVPQRHLVSLGITDLDLPAPRDIAHGELDEPGWLFPSLGVAIAGWKDMVWERYRDGVREIAPRALQRPWEQDYRSRWRLLVVCDRLWSAGYQGFAILTLSGIVCRDMRNAMKQLRTFLTEAAKAYGAPLPTYAFWLPLSAGPAERTPKGATISPLVAEFPDLSADLFETMLIPEEVQAFIEEHLGEIEAWEQGTTNGNGNGHAESAAGPADPWAEEDAAPLTLDEELPGAGDEDVLFEEELPPARPAAPPRAAAARTGAPARPAATRPAAQARAIAPARNGDLAIPFAIEGDAGHYPRGTDVRDLAHDRKALETACRAKKAGIAQAAQTLLKRI